MMRLYSAIFLFLFASQAMAFTELSVEGSYSNKVFGSSRQNDQITKTYSGSVAFYLFAYTAIEFNYMESEEETIERTELSTSEDSVIFKGYRTVVKNTVRGIGIRQAFASRKSRIRPLISLGYARQKVQDSTQYTYELISTGQEIKLKSPTNKFESDSVFASLSIQFRLTAAMSLSTSIRTVFPAFEFDQARDYQKYTIGLTWLL
jgi:hypothetical protein